MPINTDSFIDTAADPVLTFIADLELFEVITPAEAAAARANLVKDVAGAADVDALTDIVGNWMQQLTAYNAVKSRR